MLESIILRMKLELENEQIFGQIFSGHHRGVEECEDVAKFTEFVCCHSAYALIEYDLWHVQSFSHNF